MHIDLATLESVLRRETSIIDENDVALLMLTVYEEIGHTPPPALITEAEERNFN